MRKLDVITRERYLERMRETAVALAAGQDINAGPINAWAKRGLDQLAKQGRLVTEQQYQDHRRRRLLRVGDRARYIGPDRVESVEGIDYTRPHGQQGVITDVKRKGGGFLVTFRPDEPAVSTHVVDLVVLTNTPGYFTLERLTNAGT